MTSSPIGSAWLWGVGVGGALTLAASRPWLASAPVDLSATHAVARVVALSCWLLAEARREVFWNARPRRERFLRRLANALAASALPFLVLAFVAPAPRGTGVPYEVGELRAWADLGIASTLATLLLEIRLRSRVLVITFVSLSWLLPTLLGRRDASLGVPQTLPSAWPVLVSAVAAMLAIVVHRPRLGTA